MGGGREGDAIASPPPPQVCGLTLLLDTAVIGWWKPEDAADLTTRPMDSPTRARLEALLRDGYAAHLYTSHTGAVVGAHPRSLFGDIMSRFALAKRHKGAAAAAQLPGPPRWNATAAAISLREMAKPAMHWLASAKGKGLGQKGSPASSGRGSGYPPG